MITTEKGFSTLTAADLMSRDIHAIPVEMSLRAAARVLSCARITGAPVVDAKGRCVGVLSTTDILHWAEKGCAADLLVEECPVWADWQVVALDRLPADGVRRSMTADIVTASPHTRITDLTRMMLDAHIHRVIVVDGRDRPVGIVTSTDILAAFATLEESLERTGV
jgi:CBS-domain-containing membrane protein